MINYKSTLFKIEFEEQTALAKKKLLKKILAGTILGLLASFWWILGLIIPEDKGDEEVQTELIISYHGTIGKNTIQMTLNHTKEVGEYYYESQGHENVLKLSIIKDSINNNVILKETDINGIQTGRFEGQFQNDSIYTGIFTNAKGQKSKFKLTPQ